MPKPSPSIQPIEPVGLLNKPLTVDFKGLFKSVAKLAIHSSELKLSEALSDAVDAFASLGLKTESGELAYILIRRALFKAIADLATESGRLILADSTYDEQRILDSLDLSTAMGEVNIDSSFLDRPASIPIIPIASDLFESWLIFHSVSSTNASSIAKRLPSYFVYALNHEWRSNVDKYKPLKDGLQTPFTKAGEREWAWTTYIALLEKSTQEGVFDEPFSLRQLYIPLNAWLSIKPAAHEAFTRPDTAREGERRLVVAAHAELHTWLHSAKSDDSIRVVSGGPGSGKSSLARIFAASIAAEGHWRVLYIPLHLIDAKGDFITEVGRFVQRETPLRANPLDPDSREPKLLVILDGLDELASQGKAPAQVARDFVSEIKSVVTTANTAGQRLRILFCGRELVVQEAEVEFKRSREILTLLPYFHSSSDNEPELRGRGRTIELEDPNGLLKNDLRDQWWEQYGKLTGKNYGSLPEDLKTRQDLEDVTGQPLLNYLVALSYTWGKFQFSTDSSLNAIYKSLIAAVHERAYAGRTWKHISHMSLDDFSRVLEEIGLAAWHGDGRTTTVREIQRHCQESGLGKLLEDFREGAEAGVTRLLAAFFFRKQGMNTEGDPTFVFTHKSFGEYLAARRIFLAAETIVEEIDRRSKRPGRGWDEKTALKHWAEICGPAALSPYIHKFLISECAALKKDKASEYQERFTSLFSYNLRCGLPMELLQPATFQDMLNHARNAEESLLAALNAFARATGKVSEIAHPSPTAFGTWLKRIQGQQTGVDAWLGAECLSLSNLAHTVLDISDLYEANLQYSTLISAHLELVILLAAQLSYADLTNANLTNADLTNANLTNADLTHADLANANLTLANLTLADLTNANLNNADLTNAHLNNADLTNANLTRADLTRANLTNADLTRADLTRANLTNADLTRANLTNADLIRADLTRANLTRANLTGATLENLQIDGVIASRETLKLLEKFKAPDSSTTDRESLEPIDDD